MERWKGEKAFTPSKQDTFAVKAKRKSRPNGLFGRLLLCQCQHSVWGYEVIRLWGCEVIGLYGYEVNIKTLQPYNRITPQPQINIFYHSSDKYSRNI